MSHRVRKVPRFHPAIWVLAAVAYTLCNIAAAQDTGSVIGRVSDAKEEIFFESASVVIVELGQRTTTDRSGTYRFPSVPEGSYSIEVNYLGAEPITQTVRVVANQTAELDFAIGEDVSLIENILVTGKRASTLGALNRQRNADNLIGVLDSDAMGNFPDKNVAEAARRLSGVAVFNSFGEGDNLILRGLAFDFNYVTLNGLTLGADSAGGRSLGLTILAPELTAGLVVTKTVTPDMDHTGLGGAVNIETLSAFDRGDTLLQLSGAVSHQDITSENSPEAGFRYSNIFDVGDGGQLGIAAAVNWNKREFGAFPIGFGDGSGGIPGLGQGSQPFSLFTNPDGSQAFVGTESLYFRRAAVRERLGGTLNIAYKPSETMTWSYSFVGTDFQNDFDDRFTLASLTLGDPTVPVVVSATDTLTTFDALTELKFGSSVNGETDLTSHIVEFEWYRDRWLYEASVGLSSTEASTNIYDATFANSGFADTSGTALNNGRFIDFQYNDPTAKNNGAAYELSDTFEGFLDSEDEELTFKLDVTRDSTLFGENGSFKFGVQGRQRQQVGNFSGIVGFFDTPQTLDQFAAADNEFSSLYDPGVMPDVFAVRSFQDSNPAGLNTDSFADPEERFEEDVFAAYLMATIDWDNVTLVAGARLESTDFAGASRRTQIFQDASGAELDRTSSVITTENSYDNVFVDVNLRYNVLDNLIARAAFTQTLQRPDFGDLAGPQVTTLIVPDGADPIEANVIRRNYSGGNQELEPLESDNFDLSLEFYPDQDSVLSVGVFYKDVTNFSTPFNVTSLNGDIDIDAPGIGQLNNFSSVSFPVNGNAADVKGVEINFAKNFTSLPAPWDGLVATFNFTSIDSEADLDVDAQRIEAPLTFQVDSTYNISVGYEKGGFSSRLSWSDIGESVEQYSLGDSGNRISEGLRSLDLSISHAFNERLMVNFEGSNLTDEPEAFFIGAKSRPWAFEEFGRTFSLGFVYTIL